MFGRKKQIVAVKVQEEKKPEIILPTVDIVKSAGLEYLDLLDRQLTEDEEHLHKYLYTLERNKVDDTGTIDVYFIERARKKGFKLFVKPDVVKQFMYAATVYATTTIPVVHAKPDPYNYKSVIYVGDIPDFALDKIIDAQNAKIGQYISIHSNQELPVKYEKYTYRDPVIIAWNSNPEIMRRDYEWLYSKKDVTVGCVIAMWGEEGQPL